MIRRWKFVKGFSAYMVTDEGEVFRQSLVKPCSGGSNGYQIVSLSQNGQKKSAAIHSLVLATFGPPKPEGYIAHHIDGNPFNNAIENLKWISRSEHSKIHPRRKGGKRNRTGIACDNPWRGERVSSAKLTSEKVREIRRLYAVKNGKYDLLTLSKMYGVNMPTISKIINYKTWKHVI